MAAGSDSVLNCDTCGLAQQVDELAPGMSAECIRCGATVATRPRGGTDATLALTLAALVLYIPANIYPILAMNLYGAYNENTVWDGVVSLMEHNEYFVAAIVFLASIVIPRIKLLGLTFLVASVNWGRCRRLRARTRSLKCSDAGGPWAGGHGEFQGRRRPARPPDACALPRRAGARGERRCPVQGREERARAHPPHPLGRRRRARRQPVLDRAAAGGLWPGDGPHHGALRTRDQRGPRPNRSGAEERIHRPGESAVDGRRRSENRAARRAAEDARRRAGVLPRRRGRHRAAPGPCAERALGRRARGHLSALRPAGARGLVLLGCEWPQHQGRHPQGRGHRVRIAARLHHRRHRVRDAAGHGAREAGYGVLPLRRAEEGMARVGAQDPAR